MLCTVKGRNDMLSELNTSPDSRDHSKKTHRRTSDPLRENRRQNGRSAQTIAIPEHSTHHWGILRLKHPVSVHRNDASP
jgi:hypothetical protein